jgi:C-terminal processing protease CtpA/Prc
MTSNIKNHKLINDLIEIVFKYALVKKKLDKKSILSKMESQLNGENKKALYLAYDSLIEELRKVGDDHSKIRKPDYVKKWKSKTASVPAPEFEIVKKICVINVPQFIGIDEDRSKEYASKIQDIIRKNYSTTLGWIIDLRGNSGGNMEPMVAGVGPLYNSAIVGYFKASSGKLSSWGYKKGHYMYNNTKEWKVPNYVSVKRHLPIAVILNEKVVSSAEMLAISFIGNANTRSFGSPTRGKTTANASIELDDGSILFLATTSTLSRDKKEFVGKITPDVLTKDPIDDAIKWITSYSPK